MISALLIFLALLTALCLLHVRVRFEVGAGRRCLFVGLGRSGVEFDYLGKRQSVRIFGLAVRTSEIGKKGKPSDRVKAEARKKKGPKKPPRERPLGDFLRILPQCSRALWAHSAGLLKSVIVEELEAEIQGGFDSPDLTGMTFGYYQAALAAAPGVVGRIRYTPDWTGTSFSGNARGSVAIPMYRLVYRSSRLLWSLPLIELLKLAIGKKKGGQDG